MAAGKEHDQIIAKAAKAALTPLGFWRKGRSRLWLADNGFWLNLVEFQPSKWSKGSYLNVCVHWLWGLHDFLSHDHTEIELRSFIEFESSAQFEPLATQQAADAARGSLGLRTRFGTIAATAEELIAYSETLRPGGWPAYNAAVAAGIGGDAAKSGSLFEAALEGFEGWEPGRKYAPAIEQIRAHVSDTAAFRSLLEEQVNARRVSLGIEPRTNVFGL